MHYFEKEENKTPYRHHDSNFTKVAITYPGMSGRELGTISETVDVEKVDNDPIYKEEYGKPYIYRYQRDCYKIINGKYAGMIVSPMSDGDISYATFNRSDSKRDIDKNYFAGIFA